MKYAAIIGPATGIQHMSPTCPVALPPETHARRLESLIREAIALHLELLRKHGDPVPEPQTSAASGRGVALHGLSTKR